MSALHRQSFTRIVNESKPIFVRDKDSNEIACNLERTVFVDNRLWYLLSPVDLPVFLARVCSDEDETNSKPTSSFESLMGIIGNCFRTDDEPASPSGPLIEVIENYFEAESILQTADKILEDAAPGLKLVRSAVTLTISGEIESSEDVEEIEQGDSGDVDVCELIIGFKHDEVEYGLYAPLDLFFVVAFFQDDQFVLADIDDIEMHSEEINAALDKIESNKQ